MDRIGKKVEESPKRRGGKVRIRSVRMYGGYGDDG
jgi:hypothetical protein